MALYRKLTKIIHCSGQVLSIFFDQYTIFVMDLKQTLDLNDQNNNSLCCISMVTMKSVSQVRSNLAARLGAKAEKWKGSTWRKDTYHTTKFQGSQTRTHTHTHIRTHTIRCWAWLDIRICKHTCTCVHTHTRALAITRNIYPKYSCVCSFYAALCIFELKMYL